MPCKHEGGLDACDIRTSVSKSGRISRNCKGYDRVYGSAYARKSRVYVNGSGTPSDVGQAAEHLVAADLLSRNLRVTKPLNTNGEHDLHAYMSGVWRTIQVKCAQRNRLTGAIYTGRKRSSVTSDILAMVSIPTKEIRYLPNRISQLPAELETANAAL